jgi:hypothetical protein
MEMEYKEKSYLDKTFFDRGKLVNNQKAVR